MVLFIINSIRRESVNFCASDECAMIMPGHTDWDRIHSMVWTAGEYTDKFTENKWVQHAEIVTGKLSLLNSSHGKTLKFLRKWNFHQQRKSPETTPISLQAVQYNNHFATV